MSTVPRSERPAEPSEADQLRALLAAVAEALDVPVDAGASRADRDRAVSSRATVVTAVARMCSGPVMPTNPAAWLRELVAEYAPIPEVVPGE
ncbi:hypothetical protein [Nocardiopsis sp. FR26]|uniref:hypothetical protein n=1 Tax=Nocardiopsis sp. FR26 TaxID=2605987 RepID=UPI00135C7136|nr:hypothetical protein [Nocardiopsis sp. FR26]